MKRLVFFIALGWSFLGAFAAYAASASSNGAMQPRLVVHDFDQGELANRLGGQTTAWARGPAISTVGLAAGSDPAGGGALRIAYAFAEGSRSQAGASTFLAGLDASNYDHLQFRIKGDAASGYAESLKAGFLKPEKMRRAGMLQSGSVVVSDLSENWRHVTVPLNEMNGIGDWSDLQEFRVTLDSRRPGPRQGAVLIDDIALVKTGHPGPSASDPVIPARKAAIEREIGDPKAFRRQIHGRLNGWPDRLLAELDQPADDRALLLRIARDTWTGLHALTDREHGLPLDTVAFPAKTVDPERSRIGDYTNVTNIGVYLMAIAAAAELEFISREEAEAILNRTLSTLEKLETFRGFFYNYYDTTTLERTSNFISSIDSAWLTAGLMVARSAFPSVHDRATRLIEQADFGWLYDDVEQLLSHGFYVNLNGPSEYHYGLVYTEARLASLIAIGKGDVPREHWYRLNRTLDPTDYAWQSMMPVARTTKHAGGVKYLGGYYESGAIRYVPSWGGSMFEALMPTLVVDEQDLAPFSFGLNNGRHVALHRQYALDVLDYPVWGMSPSSRVDSDAYGEYGVATLGSAGYAAGVVTPHASALALVVDPEPAIANLRRLADLYDVYGDFGFYDAVDPKTGRVAYKYLALDQAMIFLAITNYLRDGAVQRYFAADPVAANVLPMLGEERFFE